MDLLARFVGLMMVSAMYITVGVEGVAYDAACTGKGVGNCTEINNICDTTSNKCACSTTSYKINTTKCATKIALTGACTATPTDQCADSNAHCHATAFTCGCKSAYFVNKTGACYPKVAFRANCVVGETAQDQCVADTECKDDGTGTIKCLCKATHYESSGTCTPRKKPGKSCAAKQCVTHATCTSGTNVCECVAGYTASPTISPTMCSGVVKVTVLPYTYVVPILVSMMFLFR